MCEQKQAKSSVNQNKINYTKTDIRFDMVFLLNRILTQNRILIPTHPQIYWQIARLRSGSVRTGDRIGSHQTGSDQVGLDRTGSDRVGPDRTGLDWIGSDRF